MMPKCKLEVMPVIEWNMQYAQRNRCPDRILKPGMI